MTNMTEERRGRIRKNIEERMGFVTHLIIFLIVNIIIILPENLIEGIQLFNLPTIGWGIGVVAHFLKAFVFNSDFVENKVDQILDQE